MPELIETLSKHNMKVSITRFCVYLYIHIVGKGGHTHPPPPFFKVNPLSRNPRCPHLLFAYQENISTE